MPKINLNTIRLMPIYQWRLRALLPLVTLIMLGLTYLIYQNYTIEQANLLKQLVDDESKLKHDLEVKYSLIKSTSLYQKKLPDLDNLQAIVSQQFPSSDDLPNLLIQINQLAENAHVAVTSLTPLNISMDGSKVINSGKALNMSAHNSATASKATGVIDGKIAVRAFTLTATANYIDFTNFVYALAQLPRVIKVDNLNLSRIDDNKINISLNITIYYSN